jgi:hypothetical protein
LSVFPHGAPPSGPSVGWLAFFYKTTDFYPKTFGFMGKGQKRNQVGEEKKRNIKRAKKATNKNPKRWLGRVEPPTPVSSDFLSAKSASNFALGGIFYLVSRAIPVVRFPNHSVS